jgi:hypothetical protein
MSKSRKKVLNERSRTLDILRSANREEDLDLEVDINSNETDLEGCGRTFVWILKRNKKNGNQKSKKNSD